MSLRDIQKEVLTPKYVKELLRINSKPVDWWTTSSTVPWPFDAQGKKITRVAERACPDCGDYLRTPCRYTQYLETCLGCGKRIGDTPEGI